MAKLTQLHIYPQRIVVSTIPVEDGHLGWDCYNLEYEHHFWLWEDTQVLGTKCQCGKEEYREHYRGLDG